MDKETAPHTDKRSAKAKPLNKAGILRLVLALLVMAAGLALALFLRFASWLNLENQAIDSVAKGNLALARSQAVKASQLMSILPDNVSFARSLHLVQLIYACRRQFDRAEIYSFRLLDFDKKVWGARSAQYASTLSELALIYRKQRKFEKAEQVYQEAIRTYRLCSGKENQIEAARNEALLAWVLIQQNKLSQARKTIEQSNDVLSKEFGKNHFEVLVGLVERAFIARKQGHEAESNADMQTAYKIAALPQPLKKSSAQTAVVLNLLAQMFADEGENERALVLFKTAADNCKSSAFGGEFNTFMADIYEPQARLLARLGRSQEAQELLKQARKIREM